MPFAVTVSVNAVVIPINATIPVAVVLTVACLSK